MADGCFARAYLIITIVLYMVMTSVRGEFSSKLDYGATACELLDSRFVAATPWIAYPIIYEPINRGRLTLWTGVCTLPTSEFKCYESSNATNSFILDFASFANKLEWTFYDINKGGTHNGISVNHRESAKYRISIKNKQNDSYLDCNAIDRIELVDDESVSTSISSSCSDCSNSLLSMVESQVKELFQSRLNEQVIDNLYWHLAQLLSNQHFSSPVSLSNNFNGV